MGLFDLPAPLFLFLDTCVDFLPAGLRVALWAFAGGILSMALYALLSPQAKIAQVKSALADTRTLMLEADDSFEELLGFARRSLLLSFRHLALVFGPALLSAFPLLCAMAWASNHFGYGFPSPGDVASLRVEPQDVEVELLVSGNASGSAAVSDELRFEWPAPPQTLALRDAAGQVVLHIPPASAIPIVHKRQWWNSLIGNPAGYLPQDSQVELVTLSMLPRDYLPFGPQWLRGWLSIFLIASVLGALVTKRLFGIA